MLDTTITLEDVEAVLAQRLSLGNDDPEAGHGMDDDLFIEVARAAADGHPQAQLMARMVCDFYNEHPHWDRWYA